MHACMMNLLCTKYYMHTKHTYRSGTHTICSSNRSSFWGLLNHLRCVKFTLFRTLLSLRSIDSFVRHHHHRQFSCCCSFSSSCFPLHSIHTTISGRHHSLAQLQDIYILHSVKESDSIICCCTIVVLEFMFRFSFEYVLPQHVLSLSFWSVLIRFCVCAYIF